MESSNKVNFKNINFKSFNDKGEKIYLVDQIINYLSTRESKGFVRDLCTILGEERRDLLESCYAILGKEHLLVLIEKVCQIQNEGGVDKINQKSEVDKKTTGGMLFYFIKKEGGLTKQNLKEIFKRDYTARNQRKKMVKKMEKLILDKK